MPCDDCSREDNCPPCPYEKTAPESARDMLLCFVPVPEDSAAHAAFLHYLDAYRDAVLSEAAARQRAYWAEREQEEIRRFGRLDHETEAQRDAVHTLINLIEPHNENH